jgi:hypothetical protein
MGLLERPLPAPFEGRLLAFENHVLTGDDSYLPIRSAARVCQEDSEQRQSMMKGEVRARGMKFSA